MYTRGVFRGFLGIQKLPSEMLTCRLAGCGRSTTILFYGTRLCVENSLIKIKIIYSIEQLITE